jgi:hypothetical protein
MNDNQKYKEKDVQDKEKNFRVQLSDDLRQEIEQMAIKYGCVYAGKPSLSKFLAKLATKQLTIREAIPRKTRDKNYHLVRLYIQLPCNLNGVIYVISGMIGDAKINICKVISKESDNYSIFTLSCPPDTDIHLFQNIRNITLNQVIEFNDSSKIKDYLSAIKDITEYTEEQLLSKRIIKELHGDKKIVTDLYLAFRFRITIENERKMIHYLLEKIADKKISIISLKVNTEIDNEGQERTNIINLLIGLYPTKTAVSIDSKFQAESTIELKSQPESINDLIKFFTIDLKKMKIEGTKIPVVKEVSLIDVNDDF